MIQTRNSRYGLRGRIGEASHPGPPEVPIRIGLVNSAHHDDVHPILLDDLERDLTPASTVPASSAVVGHVNPMMVDLTVMDTASDTSEDSRRALVQVLARRGRRLRIMGTQPTVANLHTPHSFSAQEEIRNTAATVSDELSDTVSEPNCQNIVGETVMETVQVMTVF